MLGDKKEIKEFLKYVPDEFIWFIEEYKGKKVQKSRVQERTYYRCFNEIWKVMWIDVETVKMNSLKCCFWVEKSEFAGVVYENAIKPRTSELNKEEASLLIDFLIEHWKIIWIPHMVTPRELQDLFYND